MRAGGHGEGPDPSMLPLAEQRRGSVAACASIICSPRCVNTWGQDVPPCEAHLTAVCVWRLGEWPAPRSPDRGSTRLDQQPVGIDAAPELFDGWIPALRQVLGCSDGRDLLASTPSSLTADKSDYASWLPLPLREHR